MVPVAEDTETLDDEDEEDTEDELLLAVAVLVSVPAISLITFAVMLTVRVTVSYPFRLISTVWLPTERPFISHGVVPFRVPST